MNQNIENAKALLVDFREDLIRKKLEWKSFNGESVDPHLIQSEQFPWEREEAYSWMYFDANVYRLRSSERINRIVSESPLIKIYSAPAKKYYSEWQKLEKDVYYRKNIIPQPTGNESILAYLQELFDLTKKDGSERNWWQSLRSFLAFVRNSFAKEQQGFLESLFPREMELMEEKLIRKIKKQVYPIDIVFASKIIQALITASLEEKVEAKCKTILSTLGLVWMCLTASRQRLPTELTLIYDSDYSRLIARDEATRFVFKVPTFFDGVEIPISNYLFRFLNLLSQISTLSTKTLLPVTFRSLQRTFSDIAHNTLKTENLSLLTFLSHPHEVIGHRFQPKEKR
ncbi:hypothetical protein [Parachlamydia sp.]|uniref:hypothetical protein n=1 Tax=Parachlamydia sp. TaxID=2052048 RepID=UPI003D0D7D23